MIQTLWNAVVTGSIYALAAAGLLLISSTARFVHVAYASFYALPGYVVFFLASWSRPLAATAAVMVAILGAVIADQGIFRPLRQRGSTAGAMMLTSLGFFTIVDAALTSSFGPGTHALSAGSLHVWGSLHYTSVQVGTMIASLVLLGSTQIVLRRTAAGLRLRALADEPVLARALGVNENLIILTAVVLGTLLGSSAGLADALNSGVSPLVGFQPLLVSFLIVALVGSAHGAAILPAALLVSLLEHGSRWFISSRWSTAIMFSALFLAVRLRAARLPWTTEESRA